MPDNNASVAVKSTWPYYTPSGSPSASSVVAISETVLASPAAEITLSNIPQTYRHLLLVVVGRGNDGAAGFCFPGLRFNGDVGNNYHRQLLRAVGTVVDAVETAATNVAALGAFPTGGVAAGVVGAAEALIPDYRGSNQKTIVGRATARKGIAAGDSRFEHNGLAWTGTAAISSITVVVGSGSAAFAAGTSVSLYGLGGV